MKTSVKFILIFLLFLAPSASYLTANQYINITDSKNLNLNYQNDNSKILEKPTLICPGNLSEITQAYKDELRFVWYKVPDATGYILYIDQMINNTEFENIFNSTYFTIIKDTTYLIPAGILKSNSKYKWEIKAYTKNRWSKVSESFYFQLKKQEINIIPPRLISPGNLNGKKIQKSSLKEFKWQDIQNINKYEFVLEENKNGYYKEILKKKIEKQHIRTDEINLNFIKPGETYRWKVKSIRDKYASSFSKWFVFTVTELPKKNVPILETKGSEFEEMFLSFKYADVVNTTIEAVYRKDVVYLPIEELFNLLQLYYEIDKNNEIIKGFYLNPNNTYTINLIKKEFKSLTKWFKINRKDFVQFNGKYYFEPRFFRDAFHLEFQVYLSDLSLRLNSNVTLPISQRNLDELKLYNKSFEKPEKSRVLFPAKKPMFNLGSIDYLLSSNFGKNVKPFSSYRFGLGGILLGGEGNISASGNSFEGNFINQRIEWLWRYPLFNKYITQVSAGNVLVNGLNSYNIRGLQITNEPLEPRKRYMNYKFRNRTNPNWTVELYRNNNLVSITKADVSGNYEFDLPLNYGTTLLQLKYYGLNGQIIEQEKIFQVPFSFLPPGEINYQVNAGELINSHEKIIQADVTFGINNWMTNKVGVDYLSGSRYSKGIIYNSLSARINSNYLFNLTVAPNSFVRTTVNGLFHSLSSLDVSYTKYYKNTFYNPAKINEEIRGNVFIPLTFEQIPTNVILASQYLSFGNSKRFNMNLGLNSIIGNFNPSINYIYNYAKNDLNKIQRSNFNIGIIFSLPNFGGILSKLIGNIINSRLEYNLNSNKVETAYLSFATSINENFRLQITHSRNFLNSFSNTFLSLVMDFPFVRSSSFINNDQFGQYIQGSINYDWNNEKLKTYNRQQIGRAGAIVRLFIDSNNNEIYDKGEEIVKAAQLKTNSINTISYDDDGLIYLKDLNPYTLYRVQIIETSIRDPILIPQFKVFSFISEANSIKLIDIPVYYAGEIDGTVVLKKNNKLDLLAGVKVKIKGISNDFTKIVPTFSDGGFYYFGLLPGKYKISLDSKDLQKLNLSHEPASFEIEIKSISKGDYVDKLNFVLN